MSGASVVRLACGWAGWVVGWAKQWSPGLAPPSFHSNILLPKPVERTKPKIKDVEWQLLKGNGVSIFAAFVEYQGHVETVLKALRWSLAKATNKSQKYLGKLFDQASQSGGPCPPLYGIQLHFCSWSRCRPCRTHSEEQATAMANPCRLLCWSRKSKEDRLADCQSTEAEQPLPPSLPRQ